MFFTGFAERIRPLSIVAPIVLATIVTIASHATAVADNSSGLFNKARISSIEGGAGKTLPEIAGGDYLLLYFWKPEKDSRFLKEWKAIKSWHSNEVKAIAVYPDVAGEGLLKWARTHSTEKVAMYVDGSALLDNLSNDVKTPYAELIDPKGRCVSPKAHLGFSDDIKKWLNSLPELVLPIDITVSCLDDSGKSVTGVDLMVDGSPVKSGKSLRLLPEEHTIELAVPTPGVVPSYWAKPTTVVVNADSPEITYKLTKYINVTVSCADDSEITISDVDLLVDGNAAKSGSSLRLLPGEHKFELADARTGLYEAEPETVQIEADMKTFTYKIAKRAVPILAVSGSSPNGSTVTIPKDILDKCAYETASAFKKAGFKSSLKKDADDNPIPPDAMIVSAVPVVVKSRAGTGQSVYTTIEIKQQNKLRPKFSFASSYLQLPDSESLRSTTFQSLNDLLPYAIQQYKTLIDRPTDIAWLEGKMDDGISGRSRMNNEKNETDFGGFCKCISFDEDDRGKTFTVYSDAFDHLLRIELWPGKISKGDREWWKKHDAKKVVFSAGNFDNVIVSKSPVLTWKIQPGIYTIFFCHYKGRMCPGNDMRNDFSVNYACYKDGQPWE